MYKVYILKSPKDPSKTYVGLTIRSLEERLAEHNEGVSYWTKRYKPWKVVYYEEFFCRQCAESRERFFKTGKGRKLKDLLVKHSAKL